MVKAYADCSGTSSISIAYTFLHILFLYFMVSINFQNELKLELFKLKAFTNFIIYYWELGNCPTIPTRMQTESGQTDK